MSFKHAYAPGDARLGHTMRNKDRKEKAKLEAARSDSRVEGMKKRFSVQKTVDGTAENGNGVEMQQLSPHHDRQAGTDSAAPKLEQSVDKNKKLPPNPPGAMNSTPR